MRADPVLGGMWKEYPCFKNEWDKKKKDFHSKALNSEKSILLLCGKEGVAGRKCYQELLKNLTSTELASVKFKRVKWIS